MAGNYQIIDETNWKRALHCQIFRNSIEPAFCVTLELDITKLLGYVKKRKLSFTLSLIYVVTKCANGIEEFRYRFLDGKVVLFDRIDTAFTYLNKETELFKVVNAAMQDSLELYVETAKRMAGEQKEYFSYAFEDLGLNKLWCCYFEGNGQSRRCRSNTALSIIIRGISAGSSAG